MQLDAPLTTKTDRWPSGILDAHLVSGLYCKWIAKTLLSGAAQQKELLNVWDDFHLNIRIRLDTLQSMDDLVRTFMSTSLVIV
jgi:hypothetical protein